MRSRSFHSVLLLSALAPCTTLAFDGNGSFVSQGLTRSFVYHAPGASVAPGRPLLIALHGTGGTAAGLKAATDLDAAADNYDLTVVYPNSTTIGGDLQWNVYADDQPGHGGVGDPNATDDVQFISELIDWFCDAHAIDATRVYVTGHSNGGFMVYQLALHLADRIAAKFSPLFDGPKDAMFKICRACAMTFLKSGATTGPPKYCPAEGSSIITATIRRGLVAGA